MTETMQPRRILVTGSSGFVGQHLATAIQAGVFGDACMVPLPKVDLRDAAGLAAAVEQIQPDAVIHLAAQSFVPRSFQAPEETFAINLMGTLNLLQALKQAHFQGRLLYVSSGDIYGMVPEAELPVTERRLPEPRSPYAVSKFAAEQLCLQNGRSDGLDVVIARPFNHIGPGQSDRFVLPAIAAQLARIAAQRGAGQVEVGDIDTTRDFTDVRDVVAAYALLLDKGVGGQVYQIASGTERRVRDLLDMMCALAGVDVQIKQDLARMRPAEQRRMVASAEKIRADTGWEPRFSIEQTLKDIITEARSQP